MEIYKNAKIEIKKLEDGSYGVFTLAPLVKHEKLEECPYIKTYNNSCKHIQKFKFLIPRKEKNETPDYWFSNKLKFGAVVLGYGSIYKDCIKENANVDWVLDKEKDLITFYTTKEVNSKEELLMCYKPNWTEKEIQSDCNCLGEIR